MNSRTSFRTSANTNAIELDEYSKNTERAETVVGLTDSLTIGALFAMLTFKTLEQLMFQVAAPYLFITIGLASLARSVIDWRHARKEKWKNGTATGFAASLLSGLAVAGVVALSFVANKLFMAIGPAIFAAIFALKTVFFHLPASIYHTVKYFTTSDTNPAEKARHKSASIGHGVAILANLLAIPAVVGVMILNKLTFGFLGMAAGVVGAGFTLFKTCSSPSPKSKGYRPLSQNDNRHLPQPPTTENRDSVKLRAAANNAARSSQKGVIQALQTTTTTTTTPATTAVTSPNPADNSSSNNSSDQPVNSNNQQQPATTTPAITAVTSPNPADNSNNNNNNQSVNSNNQQLKTANSDLGPNAQAFLQSRTQKTSIGQIKGIPSFTGAKKPQNTNASTTPAARRSFNS